jgi:hypothetical protein
MTLKYIPGRDGASPIGCKYSILSSMQEQKYCYEIDIYIFLRYIFVISSVSNIVYCDEILEIHCKYLVL